MRLTILFFILLAFGGCGPSKQIDQQQLVKVEFETWELVRESQEAADFIAFLAKFPEGYYSLAAELRLKAIQENSQGKQISVPIRTEPSVSVSSEAPSVHIESNLDHDHLEMDDINNAKKVGKQQKYLLPELSSDKKTVAPIIKELYDVMNFEFLQKLEGTQQVVFCLDVSASMWFHLDILDDKNKLELAIMAIKDALLTLNKGNKFNILSFSDGVNLMADEMVPCSLNRILPAMQYLNRFMTQETKNNLGTDLLLAIQKSLDLGATAIVLVTDGLAASTEKKPGIETDPDTISALVKRHNKNRVSLFVVALELGPRSPYARPLIQMAEENGGAVKFISALPEKKRKHRFSTQSNRLYNKSKNDQPYTVYGEAQGRNLRYQPRFTLFDQPVRPTEVTVGFTVEPSGRVSQTFVLGVRQEEVDQKSTDFVSRLIFDKLPASSPQVRQAARISIEY